ncbi:MAG: 1-acyl-sn-glycerol-3-phosphate acyltransferase [Nitrococcus mobilis]|nr:1-acyl-sn-glycerol-3-phosphate acyltransferase [Nitrococcus mobilis]
MTSHHTHSVQGSLIRGVIFHIGLWLSVGLWGIPSLLSFPLPYRARYWIISRWSLWAIWWLRITSGVRWEVEGLENIPAQAGIVMSKHQSTWETLALQSWFKPQTWVLKRELMWLPVFGWSLTLLRPIAINRGAGRSAIRQVIKQGRARLAAGSWVVVFPEGTRIAAGAKGRYRLGGAVLACATGAKVVPVAHNAGEFWPKHGWRKRPGCIRVRIGEPIETQGLRPEQLMTQVEAWIEGQMSTLSQQRNPPVETA